MKARAPRRTKPGEAMEKRGEREGEGSNAVTEGRREEEGGMDDDDG